MKKILLTIGVLSAGGFAAQETTTDSTVVKKNWSIEGQYLTKHPSPTGWAVVPIM